MTFDSACKLVMIHDDLLMVRGFAADSVENYRRHLWPPVVVRSVPVF